VEPAPPAGEKVDALFAKLRAASDEPAGPGAGAAPVIDAPRADKAAASAKASSPPRSARKSATPVAAAAGVGSGGKRTEVTAPAASEGSGAEVDDGDGDGSDDDGPPDDRNPAAVERDALTDPIVKALSRRLKRTLQDNQNELLAGLRSKGAHWSIDLLPESTEHIDGYATAALPSLEQAAESGVSFAGKGSGPGGGVSVDSLIGIAHELAEAVVGPLRRRLSDGDGLADAEESAVVDHVGSAFREWKGERIERLAGDHVVAAFSLGTISAVATVPSARLEWVAVPGSRDAPCPDCEDNGLSGALSPGEEFPTGHLHPPAHPGCRCVLVIPAT
jgi:hypothetical protein